MNHAAHLIASYRGRGLLDSRSVRCCCGLFEAHHGRGVQHSHRARAPSPLLILAYSLGLISAALAVLLQAGSHGGYSLGSLCSGVTDAFACSATPPVHWTAMPHSDRQWRTSSVVGFYCLWPGALLHWCESKCLPRQKCACRTHSPLVHSHLLCLEW
jgi:hypothetical protein